MGYSRRPSLVSLRRIPRAWYSFFCSFPTAEEWTPIAQAMSENAHIMLVWDRWRREWRVDIIKPGLICTGRSDDLGMAIKEAWAAYAPEPTPLSEY